LESTLLGKQIDGHIQNIYEYVGLLQALTELRVAFFFPQQHSNSLSGLAPDLPLSQEAVMFTIATAWLEPCANDPHFIVLGGHHSNSNCRTGWGPQI